MSTKELSRHHVIRMAVNGQCSVKQAAERLHLSTRRIRQLKKEYRLQGAQAVIHGNAGKPSPHALPSEIKATILAFRQEPACQDSNFTHFHELLRDVKQIKISYSTLHRLLQSEGIKSPKKRRNKKASHPSRERKEAEGMMLQADATPHDWFKNGNKATLHGFIDDATGTVTGLHMTKHECLLGYLEVLRQTLTQFGIPQSLYPDRYSVFFVNPKKEQDLSLLEQLDGVEKKVTQFGRIIERLGIDMFPAHSPQAKGRIERLWETLQSRLPVEFALHGIKTIEEANLFLQAYLPRFNAQFAIEPKESFSAYVPIDHTLDLDRLLCAEFQRVLSAGSTIQIDGKTFVIEQERFAAKTRVTLLISEKHGLRALVNGEFYPIRPLDKHQRKLGPDEMHYTPKVLKLLVEKYLLADAKAA